VRVLPIHRIKTNYVYLTQQIAAEGCAISSITMTNMRLIRATGCPSVTSGS